MRALQKISVQSLFEHSVALMSTHDVHNVDINHKKTQVPLFLTDTPLDNYPI
jgi:hypothetical protein